MATEEGVDQMEYAKILLSAYPNLGRFIKAANDNYLRRCLNSAYFSEPTETFAAGVLNLLDERRKLVDLKEKLDLLFSRLSDEERQLIKFKYAGIMPKNKFDFSLRTYFRKQIKLLEKVKTYLNYLNITEEVFKREYLGVAYFKIYADTVKNTARKKNDSRVLSVIKKAS